MEDKEIAHDAMDSAERWLKSARLNGTAGSYDSALYSLEMATEIALKAVLFSLRIDVPKMHMVGDIVVEAVRENRRIPDSLKERLDTAIGTFNMLLELRTASGYMFETKLTLKELKGKYDIYETKAADAVELCNSIVNAVSKNDSATFKPKSKKG